MSEGIIVALITSATSIVTLIVSSITNYKVKKQEKLKQDIQKVQSNLKDEMEKGFSNLNGKIDGNRRKTLKNILVNDFTQLINGEEKSKEQLQDIAEMFEEYKSLGGDSYIDDLHDIWKAKQIKK